MQILNSQLLFFAMSDRAECKSGAKKEGNGVYYVSIKVVVACLPMR